MTESGMDAAQPPSPDGGWSCAIRTVADAVVAHENIGYLRHPSGVFDRDGHYVHEAVHWRQRALMYEPAMPSETVRLDGRWLWGGVLKDHFGHFISESLGRLWALDALEGRIDGILFIPEDGFGNHEVALKSYQKALFGLLQVDLPIRLVAEPTSVQRLEVPGQGYGLGPLIVGTEPFRRFVRRRFPPVVPEGVGTSIYLSRSRLGAQLGGVIAETRIEELFEAAGYQIYHPQLHSVAEQFETYLKADRIVSIDGSALHFLALIARPDQKIAVILRRRGNAPLEIAKTIKALSGADPVVIDAIQRVWIRADRNRPDNLSYGEVDFGRLAERLAASGFLAQGTVWATPTRRFLDRMIGSIERRLGKRTLVADPPLEDARPAKAARR